MSRKEKTARATARTIRALETDAGLPAIEDVPLPSLTPPGRKPTPRFRAPRARGAGAGAVAALAASTAAHASLLHGETLDAVADVMAWVVIVIVPIIAIAIFWLVHVLPEKIAHKRHHPQTAAIQTLCLLSLVFGGLLWPIAWLWAYTRPVLHKMAYGTDKHDDHFTEVEARIRAGDFTDAELARLREELDAMRTRGAGPGNLQGIENAVAARVPGGGQA